MYFHQNHVYYVDASYLNCWLYVGIASGLGGHGPKSGQTPSKVKSKRRNCFESRLHNSLYLILYNDQRNAQVFNLYIYLILPYVFRAFF
jgi:hypothetical protein